MLLLGRIPAGRRPMAVLLNDMTVLKEAAPAAVRKGMALLTRPIPVRRKGPMKARVSKAVTGKLLPGISRPGIGSRVALVMLPERTAVRMDAINKGRKCTTASLVRLKGDSRISKLSSMRRMRNSPCPTNPAIGESPLASCRLWEENSWAGTVPVQLRVVFQGMAVPEVSVKKAGSAAGITADRKAPGPIVLTTALGDRGHSRMTADPIRTADPAGIGKGTVLDIPGPER